MAKTEGLSFRVAGDTKEALERAAKDADRSISYIVERVVRAWLTEQGYLPKPSP